MPQELALIDCLTVREILWVFGAIYGLTNEIINERFAFLSHLLELPIAEKLIRDCSGGQKRRISFALTLIHDPDILILDEPTVGYDPLLRNKIWNYLTELTSLKNVTVLLSTHYIEEAKQSNYIGLIKNGIQIAEDSPRNILKICQTLTLEEAFLKLTTNQDTENISSSKCMKIRKRSTIHEKKNSDPSTSREEIENVSLTWKILRSLVVKNRLQFTRHPGYVKTSYISDYQ